MYILKNALRTINRSKGRNILIGIIVLVIAVSSCIALSIRQAAATAKESGKESLEITAQISIDRQAMINSANSGENSKSVREMFQQSEDLSLDEMLIYSDSEYVKDFYYTLSASLNGSDDLEAVSTQTSDETEDNSSDSTQTMPGGDMPQDMKGGGMSRGMGTQGDFTLTGYSSKSAMTDFLAGTSYISDGVIFDEASTDILECIISDELAALNEIKIGDTISLLNPNNEDETFELTVVGTYTNTESAVTGQSMMGFNNSSDPANQIYTNYNVLKSISDSSAENAETETDEVTGMTSTSAIRSQVSGTYSFKDIESYEGFQEDAYTLGLSEDYTIVSSDVSSYKQSLEPLEDLSKYATYFIIVVLLIGGIILVVFNIFNIRERKYEIGVLTAIGMKKKKVAVQFVTELFAVTFIAIVIGTSVGAVVSVPVTNKLLEGQISSTEQQDEEKMSNFSSNSDMPSGTMQRNSEMNVISGGLGQQVDNYISEISSATNITVILQLIGIGVVLTLISSLAAVVFVMRYEPLKILSNRA